MRSVGEQWTSSIWIKFGNFKTIIYGMSRQYLLSIYWTILKLEPHWVKLAAGWCTFFKVSKMTMIQLWFVTHNPGMHFINILITRCRNKFVEFWVRKVFIGNAWGESITKEDRFERGTINLAIVLVRLVRYSWDEYSNFKLKGEVVAKKFDLHVMRQCPTQKNYSQVTWFIH